MPKKLKSIHFEHQYKQTYQVWCDLSDEEIEYVEGVTVVEKVF